MDSCDVLIVGASRAGSSCAWGLKGTALDTVILDKSTFPGDKVCGGWVTPAALDELDIDPKEYVSGHVLQPIIGFLTSRMGGREIRTEYGGRVSFGIRRREFDEFLLKRCGARIFQGMALKTLERSAEHALLASRFGKSQNYLPSVVGRHLPAQFFSCLARILLANPWFSRHVVLDHWFLHRTGPAMNLRALEI